MSRIYLGTNKKKKKKEGKKGKKMQGCDLLTTEDNYSLRPSLEIS